MARYSISDETREQCMFILHGDGNNGKSLLLDVIFRSWIFFLKVSESGV